MPRKNQPESPAGLPATEWTQPGELPLQEPDYKLSKYEPPKFENRTSKGFVGRVASGRGRTITADDTSYAIESDKPLTAGEIALAQKNGFDDFSEKSDGTIMVGDKGEVRRANGDINHVAYALTSRNAGRER